VIWFGEWSIGGLTLIELDVSGSFKAFKGVDTNERERDKGRKGWGLSLSQPVALSCTLQSL